jgi:hypothetical protein
MKEYTHIKKNIFIDRKKQHLDEDEAYICSCDRPIVRNVNIENR